MEMTAARVRVTATATKEVTIDGLGYDDDDEGDDADGRWRWNPAWNPEPSHARNCGFICGFRGRIAFRLCVCVVGRWKWECGRTLQCKREIFTQ